MPRIPSRISGSTVTQTLGTTPIGRVVTGDYHAQAAQRAAEAGTAPSRALPFGDGNLIADIPLLAGTAKDIDHRLGRKYQGWIIVRLQTTAAPVIVELPTLPLNMRDKQIRIQATAICLVDLWIF